MIKPTTATYRKFSKIRTAQKIIREFTYQTILLRKHSGQLSLDELSLQLCVPEIQKPCLRFRKFLLAPWPLLDWTDVYQFVCSSRRQTNATFKKADDLLFTPRGCLSSRIDCYSTTGHACVFSLGLYTYMYPRLLSTHRFN